MDGWPVTTPELIELQLELATTSAPRWRFSETARIGACYVCFERGPAGPGSAGDAAWAAASLGETHAAVEGVAPAPYRSGLLAL
ncbi:MAG: endonuclease V, partial [Gaiellaceae bacterium]